MGTLVTLSGVQELLRPTSPDGHISRRRADQITRKPGFPDPVQTTPAGRLWDSDVVAAWIAENRTAPDADGGSA